MLRAGREAAREFNMFGLRNMHRGGRGKRSLGLVTGALGIVLTTGAAWAGVAPSQYTVTLLGYLPGDIRSGVSGINPEGQVVGTSIDASGNTHAFVYDASGMHMVASGYGQAINAAGQVLVDGSNSVSVYNLGGSVTTLPGKTGQTVYGSAINDSGAVAATYNFYASNASAFTFANGLSTPVGTLGGPTSEAWGINDNGQVVGFSATASGASHAFRYTNGSMLDLGTLGGATSTAYAIGANGNVVGVADTGAIVGGVPVEHAFLYSNGVMQDLGTLNEPNSDARSINDLGQIVGETFAGPMALARAYVYENGTMYDLNSLLVGQPDLTVEFAYGINDNGQIAATAYVPGTYGPEAVLLTPTTATMGGSTSVAVPLPSAVWMGLMSIGAIVTGMAVCGRLRRHISRVRPFPCHPIK
jgi:probable HAF family extracellular repeat protein